jgi:hypothetical protein
MTVTCHEPISFPRTLSRILVSTIIETTLMSRSAPAKITPIVHNGTEYTAPWSDRGVLIAKDAVTGAELWRVLVVDYWINPILETDVQEVYFKSMSLQPSGNEILVTDEVGVNYLVDLRTRSVSILNWTAKVQIVEWRPTVARWDYWVQLTITNSLNRELLLDPVSVAKDGNVSNDLFAVTMDGNEVPYRGAMMKRAPPDPKDFIRLRAGQSYAVRIELSEWYRVSSGAHQVSVAFAHTNHFSPDAFRMTSKPDSQTFAGDGHVAEL